MVESLGQPYLANAHPLNKNTMIFLSLGQGLVRLRHLLAEQDHFGRCVVRVLVRLGKTFQPMAKGLRLPGLSANILGQVAHNFGAQRLRVVSPLAAAVG